MAKLERASFGSRLGVILATAGSAVGLGNIWRFPYMAGQNGGAVFILIYVFCVLLLGIPCMISEFIIGRHGQANTARAYRKVSGGTAWSLIGYMGVLTGFLISGYYAVVSGWCLEYVWASLIGSLEGSPEVVKSYFGTFSQDPVKPVAECGEGHRVPVQTGYFEVERRCVLGCPRPVVLFAEHRDGLYLHLCQLFLKADESGNDGSADRSHRLHGGAVGWTGHLPCRFLRWCRTRQRSFAHLHHPAQRVPAGLWRSAFHRLWGICVVLCSVVDGSSDLADLLARGEYGFPAGRDGNHP